MWVWLALATIGQAAPNQPHNDCLLSVASELEMSGDTASEIAAATVTACARNKEPPRSGSLLATMTPTDRAAFDRLEDKLDYDSALLAVVRIRACRKAPGCRAR